VVSYNFKPFFPGIKDDQYSKSRRRAGNLVTSPPTSKPTLCSVALTTLSMLLYMETNRCLYLNYTKYIPNFLVCLQNSGIFNTVIKVCFT
jgi:hypothetical protein